jgi:hypothetical protein
MVPFGTELRHRIEYQYRHPDLHLCTRAEEKLKLLWHSFSRSSISLLAVWIRVAKHADTLIR